MESKHISNVQSTFLSPLQSHNSATISWLNQKNSLCEVYRETPLCTYNYSHQTLFGGLRFFGTIMLIQGPLHMDYKL